MLLNNQWVIEEIKKKIKKKNLEANQNENTKIQNIWDAAKAVLRGKFIMIQVYLRKLDKYQINNLVLHLIQQGKEQTKPKVSRRKKTITIRAERNEIETKK